MNVFLLTLFRSTPEEQARRSERIPDLKRARKWAARKAAKAKMESTRYPRKHQSQYVSDDDSQSDSEYERVLNNDFVSYQERQIEEQKEQRRQEEAAFIAAEEARRTREAEEQRQAIVAQAREDFKEELRREIQERETRQQRMRERLRDELLKLKIPPEQVRSIAESVDFTIDENPDTIKLMTHLGQKEASSIGDSFDDENSMKTDATSLQKSSSILPWYVYPARAVS